MSLTTFTIKKVKELGVTLSTASKIPFKDPEAYGNITTFLFILQT